MQDTLRILVNGKPVKVYASKNKLFIEGRKNQEYSIQIKNTHAARKLFSVTCDSINVIDGKVGSERGYVIPGFGAFEIKGFRTSNSEVAAFRFSSKEKSYAAKSESTNFSTENVGVIGLRVFNEVEKSIPTAIYNNFPYIPPVSQIQWWYPPYQPASIWTCNSTLFGPLTANYMSGVQNAPTQEDPSFSLGTEFGQIKSDSVSSTEFENGSLLETVEVFYGTLEDLKKMGVDIRKETQISFPKSFPNEFCKPPRK